MWATWKLICLGLCLHACCTIVLGEKSSDEVEREYFSKFQKALNLTSKDKLKEMPTSSLGISPPPKPFECDTSIPEWYTPATNIWELTPWDISIIGALGDSVTAGFGADATTIIGDIIEYRWLSWSIGGDKDITEVSTLPNIIRAYNDQLKGYSVRGNAHNNVARSGAKSPAMRGQAEDLYKKMLDDSESKEELDNQWKIITLWIGGNDLCDTCSGTPEENANAYKLAVKDSLDYIFENFKRTFVNLVGMIDITQLMELEGFWCPIVHPLVCSCATNERTKELVKQTAKQYNVELERLLETGNYTREDFTVALQPFFSDTVLPRLSDGKPDGSYFAPDCFHFSTRGHGVGALYLWNNMLEKQGEKTDFIDWNDVLDYICISEEYRYFTVDQVTDNLKRDRNDEGASTDSIPIAVGSAMAVLAVAIAVIAVVAVVVHRWKKKSSDLSLEKLQLISVKI